MYKNTRKKAIKQIYKQPLFTLDKSELMSLISNIEKDLLAQKEDKKECICNPFTKTIICPIHGIKSKSTHSPLEIEKIKEISLPYSDAEITINKLIRNQKKLYQYIKEKL